MSWVVCPNTNAFSVVIIIEDTSRVSNIYIKQALQNTEYSFINQLPSVAFVINLFDTGQYFDKNTLETMGYDFSLSWL